MHNLDFNIVHQNLDLYLIPSIFIFDKFVDGAQPEVACEIASRRHILRTLEGY